jgi:hypothetical protein
MFWKLEQIVMIVATFMIGTNNFKIATIVNVNYDYCYVWNNFKITWLFFSCHILIMLFLILLNARSDIWFKSNPKSAIIVNMNSHLDFQNFIGYGSAYGSYNFLMNLHLNPPGSNSDPIHWQP